MALTRSANSASSEPLVARISTPPLTAASPASTWRWSASTRWAIFVRNRHALRWAGPVGGVGGERARMGDGLE
eukprot:CAMPEP_0170292034 /NCGR_PEP_ID=MMETSP0116_2-20130129/46111_1 /TAXON_ID=400756 /ORGANISM="Durinskia baltica, Strain CSIRO CS-38" /LENGTH=72 /DNA_ID=CAMNT_0010543525 /DNA_START=52 /DNA_END=267 /DNA_ORIENTATION=-